MAAPAYEYEALAPLRIGGALGYAVGDLVPASVVDAQGWDDTQVRRRDAEELEGAQAPADERVPDDSTGEPPFGAVDDEPEPAPARRRKG